MIKDSLKRLIKVKEAAGILGISIRQVYRLRKSLKEEGIKGIIHHLKGRVSSKKTPKQIEEKIKRLYKEKYLGFNISHFTEYLNEEENIIISREMVRKILRGEDFFIPNVPRSSLCTEFVESLCLRKV